MSRLVRNLSDDSVAGHVEVERREESRQSGLIRRRSRKVVRYPGQPVEIFGLGMFNVRGVSCATISTEAIRVQRKSKREPGESLWN
jgi:hypothetical protein